MKGKRKGGSKGQSLVEAALTLSIVIMVILFMISIGIYIFNKVVFVYAVNKAADTGAAMMLYGGAGAEEGTEGPGEEEGSGSGGNGLSQSEKDSVRDIAINATGISMMTSDIEASVNIYDRTESTVLEVEVTGKYNCAVPFIDELFPQIKANGIYVCIKR